MNPSDAIDIVQPFFAARLQSLAFFGNIAIGAPRMWKEGEKQHTPKSISDTISNALIGLIKTGGAVGAAVTVFQPTLQMKKTNGREAVLTLVCRVEVNPILNFSNAGTNKFATQIAYEVLRAGQGYTLLPGFCTLFADGDCFLPYVGDNGRITVDVLFHSNFAVSPLQTVVTPQLVLGDNGLVTLNNVTIGADIYYSTRLDIFPGPQTAAALIYGQPFTVDSGTPVLWAAYLNGLAGSNLGFQTINY